MKCGTSFSVALALFSAGAAVDVCDSPCREWNHPIEGVWNVDRDCCAVRSAMACADGYRLEPTDDVCGKYSKAYNYQCTQCDEDDDSCQGSLGGEEVRDCRDYLAYLEERKYGHSKTIAIVAGSSAVVSLAASLLLIVILVRSCKGLKTTYHRLLLGLSCSDILYSSGYVSFGAVTPSDQDYWIWNAQGSQASCDAFGFVWTLGAGSGVSYMCALNLYYLAQIKYNKTESYIARKIEPFLHRVPILIGFIYSTFFVATDNISASDAGVCTFLPQIPPHCEGYEEGVIPEGFEDPCRRGYSSFISIIIFGIITLLIPPIVIGTSLWMIYKSVSRTEQRIARYGAGAINASNPNEAQRGADGGASAEVEGGNKGSGGAISVLFAIRRKFRRGASRTIPDGQESSHSRAVLHKAAAYSVAYFLTFGWAIIAMVVETTGAEVPEFYWYLQLFFLPLQGLWTLLIYMHPRAMKARRSSDRNMSWPRAFAAALRSAVHGGNDPPRRGRGRARARPVAPGTAATRRAAGTAAARPRGAGGDGAPAGAGVGGGRASRPEGEEERAEIEPRPQDDARGDKALAPGTNADPPPVPGAEGNDAPAGVGSGEAGVARPEGEEEKTEIEPHR